MLIFKQNLEYLKTSLIKKVRKLKNYIWQV